MGVNSNSTTAVREQAPPPDFAPPAPPRPQPDTQHVLVVAADSSGKNLVCGVARDAEAYQEGERLIVEVSHGVTGMAFIDVEVQGVYSLDHCYIPVFKSPRGFSAPLDRLLAGYWGRLYVGQRQRATSLAEVVSYCRGRWGVRDKNKMKGRGRWGWEVVHEVFVNMFYPSLKGTFARSDHLQKAKEKMKMRRFHAIENLVKSIPALPVQECVRCHSAEEWQALVWFHGGAWPFKPPRKWQWKFTGDAEKASAQNFRVWSSERYYPE